MPTTDSVYFDCQSDDSIGSVLFSRAADCVYVVYPNIDLARVRARARRGSLADSSDVDGAVSSGVSIILRRRAII